MINARDHYVAWAMLVTELDEAREHLQDLIDTLARDGRCDDEDDFSARLGHVYAHLNRAWHSRDLTSELTQEQHAAFAQFPKDLEPVG